MHSVQVLNDTIYSFSFNMQGDIISNRAANNYILYNRLCIDFFMLQKIPLWAINQHERRCHWSSKYL